MVNLPLVEIKNNMKLSASINLFDGEELLFTSLTNLRPVVDHISVVYQLKSNFNLDFDKFYDVK